MEGNHRTVIVTGGAGYIGSQVCKQLHQAGYLPVALDNLSKGRREAVRWGPLEEGDVGDCSFVTQVLLKHKPVGVIHLAASTDVGESVRQPGLYYQNNTAGTLSLLRAMQEQAVRVLIFSSTCATYGDVKEVPITESTPQWPINPYGWSKLFGEQMIRDFRHASGLRFALLRYFNVAGADLDGELGEDHDPPSHVIPILFDVVTGRGGSQFRLFGEDYATPDGTCVRDYIHVADLADAHIKALEYLLQNDEGLALNLGSGSGFSVKQLITEAEKVIGKQIPIQNCPRRPGDAPTLVADSQLATRVLGWKPQHSDLETILTTAWRWHRR
jgi:UDP-glucose-4-epimerase GalE